MRVVGLLRPHHGLRGRWVTFTEYLGVNSGAFTETLGRREFFSTRFAKLVVNSLEPLEPGELCVLGTADTITREERVQREAKEWQS